MRPQLPAPDPEDPRSETAGSQRRSKNRIPSIDDLLEMLQQLNSLVMLNVLSTAKAGIIHRNLRTILDVHMRRSQSGAGELPQEDLVKLCREQPHLLSILERFFTDEQLRWLMDQIKDDHNDQA